MNWIDKNTANLHQQSLEAAMSKIWNGFEIVSEFKMQGIGPDNFELYKVDYKTKNIIFKLKFS